MKATMNDKPSVRGTNIQWNMAVSANCPLDQSTSDMSIDSSIELRISELFQYVVAPLLIALEVPLQQIGEEKQAQNCKHDKEFDQDNAPEFSAPGHVPESLVIKTEYPFDHDVQILCLKSIIP
jgi:hypothetical protein